jgi:carbon-monoxide dehydrogenase small subunit
MLIQLTVNHKKHAVEVDPADVLLDVLRNLGYKSVQRGCDTSNCGLCSVLADGEPVLSCSTLAWQAEGKLLQTIEGLHGEVERVASCLAGEGSDQCGYCSPGLILSTIALKNKLLARSADAVRTVSDDEINQYLLGNLCRCTGYVGQLRAIRRYLAGPESTPVEAVAINPGPVKAPEFIAALPGQARGTSVGRAVEKLDSRAILHGKASILTISQPRTHW